MKDDAINCSKKSNLRALHNQILLTGTDKDNKSNILRQWKIGVKLKMGNISCYIFHADKQKVAKAAAYFSPI